MAAFGRNSGLTRTAIGRSQQGGFFYSQARARRLKNPFNLNLLRGDDQRRQGHLAERNSDFWSFLRGSLG